MFKWLKDHINWIVVVFLVVIVVTWEVFAAIRGF